MSLTAMGHTHGANAQQKWQELNPAGAGFRVEFPGQPKTRLKQLPSKVGDVAVLISVLSLDNGAEFITMYSDFPAGTFSAVVDRELDTIRDENLRAVTGKLLSQSKLVIGGASARRFAVSFHDGMTIATVLIVLNGQRLYQAICIAPAAEPDNGDVLHFINSFALVTR